MSLSKAKEIIHDFFFLNVFFAPRSKYCKNVLYLLCLKYKMFIILYRTLVKLILGTKRS